MRGLVIVLLQRSEMTGDGTPVMETIGQIPGSCEELFGLRGNSKSELVGASQERLGKKAWVLFFPGRSLEETRTETTGVRRRAAIVPQRSLWIACRVDVGKAAGVCVLL